MKTSRHVSPSLSTAVGIAFAGLALAAPAHGQQPEGPPAEGQGGAGAGGGGSEGSGSEGVGGGAGGGGGGIGATGSPVGAGRAVLGYGNPQSNNGTIGGGNATESSSHPVTGDEEDSFDTGGNEGSSGSVRGGRGSPVFLSRPTMHGEPPSSHVVRHGDTLWGLCDTYFQNPYQWPRLWSYNPQIKNPHWIYPGDEIRLREGGGATAGAGGQGEGVPPAGPSGTLGQGGAAHGQSLVDRRRQVPNGTVFLRDAGWIHDKTDEVWGAVAGSSSDTMFLSNLDEIYLAVQKGRDVRLGQELAIFRPRTTEAAGQIVQILGTVRVDQWDPQNGIARGRIVETLDTIERGALVGPVARSFEVVPPRRNEADVQAHVLASLHPNVFFGQENVVFIDKGSAAGLKPGNRLFVVRRGDAWRRSLVTPAAGLRVSPDDERPLPPLEKTPSSKAPQDKYPDEVTAELLVLDTKKDTAACLVLQARLEIELHDLAVSRKGY